MPVLLLIVFIDLLGFGLVIPLLPFFGLHFGASTNDVTWLLGTYSLAQLVSAPLLGRLSDRFGRRPVLLLGLTASVLSYLWMAFAGQLWMLFAARFLSGAGGGTIGAVFAYVTDVTPADKRARGMGMVGAALGLGFTVGPAVGGLLAGTSPEHVRLLVPCLVAAGLSALALVLTAILLKESLPAAARQVGRRIGRLAFARHVLQRPVLRRLIVIAFLTTAAFAVLETIFAIWASHVFDWGPRQVGFFFLYVGLVLIVVQGGAIHPLAKRFGEVRLLIGGVLLLTLGLLGMGFVRSLAELLVASGALSIGMALFSPASNSLISREASADERGGILGVSQSTQSLARVVGPLVSGPLFTVFGRSAPYFAGAAAMLLVVYLAFGLLRGAAAEAGIT
jgi:DHA1 family tetracycline resistance protein-like MFS transporter